MDHWEPIATAPYDRDLEVAVIEGGEVHALAFACRRKPKGWVDVRKGSPLFIRPTHWRYWLSCEHNEPAELYLNPAR